MELTPYTEFNFREDGRLAHYVRLHDEVVRQLEPMTREAGRGILLGKISRTGDRTADVKAIEIISDHDWRGLEIALRKTRVGLEIVGYYRLHAPPDTSIGVTDRLTFQQYFCRAGQVFLAIAAPHAGCSAARFYLGDRGALYVERTTVEFPLSLSQLLGPADDTAPIEAPATPVPVPVAAAATPAPVITLPPPAVKKSAAPPPAPAAGRGWAVAAGVAAMLVTGSIYGVRLLHARLAKPVPAVVEAAAIQPAAEETPAPPPPPPPEQIVPAPEEPAAEEPAAPVFISNPDVAAQPMRQFVPLVPESIKSRMPAPVTVRVRAHVDASGRVVDAVALTGGDMISEALGQAAVESVRRWKFTPALKRKRRVASQTVVSLSFEGGPAATGASVKPANPQAL